MLDLLLSDDAWALFAGISGLVAVGCLVAMTRARPIPVGRLIASSLNLFYGVAIGILGTGHLVAVGTKTLLGTLPPNIRLWFALPFGFAVAVPVWCLVASVARLTEAAPTARRRAMGFNAWLAVVLAVPARPLAVFAAVNLILLGWLVKKRVS